jgi:hypothetical protein
MNSPTRITLSGMALVAVLALILTCADFVHADCGDRGGPGYRGPNEKCVSWAEIGRVCGNPPTTKCRAENVATGSQEAADHGVKIQGLRSSAQAEP